MTILVTGVAGRVGSSLAQQLVRRGYDVRGMVRSGGRPPDESLSRNVEIVEASLTDALSLNRAVSGTDTIVHLAAQMVVGDTPIDEYFDINVLGTLRLLEAATAQNRRSRRFIYASTDNTYGPAAPQAEPITENHPQIPGDYYGMAKVLCERLVQNYHKLHDIDYSILRLGSVVAPNEAVALFRLSWIRSFLTAHARAGRRSNLWQLFGGCESPETILDAATGVRNDDPAAVVTDSHGRPWSIHLTDVRDAVMGITLALERPASTNEHFNIVGPRTTTFEEGAAAIASRCDLDTVTIKLPMRLAFELSTSKAYDLLGYQPRWNFDDTVAHALRGSSNAEPDDYIPVRG